MATQDDHGVSADLAGFTDAEWYERERWARIEREYLSLAEPLSKMVGPKIICEAIDVSGGQLSRELSPHYDSRPSLIGALCIGRASQNERLASLIVCDGLGMRMPEWQKRKVTAEDELRAIKEECRASGAAGEAIMAGAARRARGGR